VRLFLDRTPLRLAACAAVAGLLGLLALASPGRGWYRSALP
jgi:hypothetical protein